MRIRIVARSLGFLLGVITLSMAVPLIYSAVCGEPDALPFAASIAASVAVSSAFYLLGKGGRSATMRTREAIACVALSWAAASAVGALPFYISGAVPSYTDSYFEAMSGFTTTGATIIPDIDIVPRGLLLWRSIMHWLGGVGIIVLTLIFMPAAGADGFNLYVAEVPGLDKEKMTPRIRETAVILWCTYTAITFAEAVILLFAGMGIYDAATHAMSTISTGGFSPHNGSAAYFNSAFVDWTITIFMFLSGINFALYYQVVRGRSIKNIIKDAETRFYTAVMLAISFAITADLYFSNTFESLSLCARHAFFQVASFITTTGFLSANYDVWPLFSQGLLFLCLFMGGCAGSTAGGIKQIRLLVYVKAVARHVKKTISPRAIIPLRVGDTVVDDATFSSGYAFLGLYFTILAVGIFLISLFESDQFTAIAAVITALGNVGPGYGAMGATGSFAGQAPAAKWIYSFLMMCGRLELYTVMILFSRQFWSEGVIIAGEDAAAKGRISA